MLLSVLLLIAFLIVIDYFHRQYDTRKFRKLPIISKIPFVGTLIAVGQINSDNFSIKWPEYVKRYGKTFYARIFASQIVVTVDQKLIEILLSSQQHIHKHLLYNMLNKWLGDGLLLSSDKTWQTMRKIITPSFHFKILEQYVEVFDRQTNTLLEKLRPIAEDAGRSVNIYEYINLLTMDIIGETAMGVTINAQADSKSEYVKAVHDVTEILSTRFVRPQLALTLTHRLLAPNNFRRQEAGIKIMHEFTEKIIKERQMFLINNNYNSKEIAQDHEEIGIKKRMSFLDVMLQSTTADNEPLSDKQIRDEVNTFMFEGHDTTTSAISFCLYAISRHAQVQNKLFEEIREYFGDDPKRPVCYNDMQQLSYLNSVIKESLRLYPPVMAIGRWLKDDMKIDDDTILPAGTNIIVLLWEMFRDPEVFVEPLKFIPERHLNESIKSSAFSYIPFSAGPRNCVGQRFAQYEMRTVIIKIIQNYELLPLGAEIMPTMKLILRSKTGVNIGLRSRQYKK